MGLLRGSYFMAVPVHDKAAITLSGTFRPEIRLAEGCRHVRGKLDAIQCRNSPRKAGVLTADFPNGLTIKEATVAVARSHVKDHDIQCVKM